MKSIREEGSKEMNRVETIAKYFFIWEPSWIVMTVQSRRISRADRSVTTLYYSRSKMCRIRQINPNYINIRINNQKQQDKKATTQPIRYRINQEIKFLYRKKKLLNKRLYIEHLKGAQLYNGMWQYIQNNIEAKLSRDMDEVYERLNRKLNSLTQQNAQQNSPQSRHKKHVPEKENRVVNLTNITFTKEHIKTLEMDTQYAIERNPKYYINELIIDTENAIKTLQSNMQNTFRYLAAKKVKQIGESNRHNTIHERHQYNINQIKKTLQQNNLTIAREDKSKALVIIDKTVLKQSR